jgi:hypothetical protein
MALSTTQSNNKLVKFTQEINREFVRENTVLALHGRGGQFHHSHPYGTEKRRRADEYPDRGAPSGKAIGSGTLVGNEEQIDQYGMRVWLDWARNAVVTNKAKSSATRPISSARPSRSVRLDQGTSARRNDRRLDGPAVRIGADRPWLVRRPARQRHPLSGRHRGRSATRGTRTIPTACCTAMRRPTTTRPTPPRSRTATRPTTTDGRKPVAAQACCEERLPKIRPFKTKNGYEYYVAFMGPTRSAISSSLATSTRTPGPRRTAA